MERIMIYKAAAAVAAAVLPLTSCVMDVLYNTPHPETGIVVMTADFTQRSQTADVPAEYNVSHACCGSVDICTMPSAVGKSLPWFLQPETHTFYAWTSCKGMKADGETVKVEETAAGKIESLPGHLFTARHDVVAAKDDTVRVDVPMAQRTRDLQFNLTVTEGDPELIASVAGELSGIAGTFSLADQKVAGDPAGMDLAFDRNGASLTSSARLLGTMGPVQKLSLEIRFTDRADVHKVEVDLTDALSGFGSDMLTARVVTGNVETPIGMDATAEITGWKDVDGDPAVAD